MRNKGLEFARVQLPRVYTRKATFSFRSIRPTKRFYVVRIVAIDGCEYTLIDVSAIILASGSISSRKQNFDPRSWLCNENYSNYRNESACTIERQINRVTFERFSNFHSETLKN